MPRKPHLLTAVYVRRGTRTLALAALALSAFSTGCVKQINEHAKALATATAPVVDQAAAAYNSANVVHAMRTDYDAIDAFDKTDPVYNPRHVPPLLSPKDISARLKVLAAFQAYAQSVVAITNGTDSPALQAAATSAGANLTGLGNTLAPSVESVFGIATATAATTPATATTPSAPADPLSATTQNVITVGIDALGQFLVNRKLQKDLPPLIVSMDPHVEVLCELLENDVTLLRGIEDRDYDSVIDRQTLFIRQHSSQRPEAVQLDPAERQQLIMKLPAIYREQQASDQQLTALSAAVAKLYLTHHALATEAQGNNPASLQQKLADLEAAGSELGKFYTSLSAASATQ